MQEIKIGKIVNTIGLRGMLKVVTSSNLFNDVTAKYPIYVKKEKQIFYLTIKKINHVKGHYQMQTKEINNIDEAEKYKNLDLYAQIDSQEILEDDEYLIRDLKNLPVFAKDKQIGIIKEIISMPANDILKITKNDQKTMLIPFIKRYVEVDIGQQKIILHHSEEFNEN